MKSKEILPESKRLDRMGLLQLEGLTTRNSYVPADLNNLIIKYHKALQAAESELKSGGDFTNSDLIWYLYNEFPIIRTMVNEDELDEAIDTFKERYV